jgi:hypothetical protein
MYLDYKELLLLIEEAGDIAVGSSVRIHHCKSGHGNKGCSVTRTEDAHLVNCFHCGGKGVVSDKYSRVRRHQTGGSKAVKSYYTPPEDSTELMSDWPIKAIHWVGAGGLTREEANRHGMRYSARAKRVYVPLLKGDKVVGWLGRLIEGEGAKYLLNKQEDFLFHIDKGTDTCIIVEDVLSAIRIGRHHSVIAILGTSLSDYQVGALSKRYKGFKIWLDDDNPTVKMKQVSAKNRLDIFGRVSMIKTEHDPKTYTDKQIEEVINNEQ